MRFRTADYVIRVLSHPSQCVCTQHSHVCVCQCHRAKDVDQEMSYVHSWSSSSCSWAMGLSWYKHKQTQYFVVSHVTASTRSDTQPQQPTRPCTYYASHTPVLYHSILVCNASFCWGKTLKCTNESHVILFLQDDSPLHSLITASCKTVSVTDHMIE